MNSNPLTRVYTGYSEAFHLTNTNLKGKKKKFFFPLLQQKSRTTKVTSIHLAYVPETSMQSASINPSSLSLSLSLSPALSNQLRSVIMPQCKQFASILWPLMRIMAFHASWLKIKYKRKDESLAAAAKCVFMLFLLVVVSVCVGRELWLEFLSLVQLQK